ncbi:MAG: NADH-quinone oxidoreductase subunit D, partial [Ktedonobacterales bacterium]
MTINMGPQHPSTHGVLRLVLTLDGETVIKAQPEIGYLHTGIEKTAESKSYFQALVVTDRMDYLAPLCNNLAYSLAVEKLLGIDVPERVLYARVILAELQRIASHLVWLGTSALDLGAQSVFLYCFREREQILDIFEACSGVRMMTSYIMPGGLQADLPPNFEQLVRDFIAIFPSRLREYHDLLTNNRLWTDRTQGVGKISAEDAIALGCTGATLRGSGVAYDVRKYFPYGGYDRFEFDIPVGTNGDVYDRYLVRMLEMDQSLRIVQQAMDGLPGGAWQVDDHKIVPPPKYEISSNMEALIHHFKLYT